MEGEAAPTQDRTWIQLYQERYINLKEAFRQNDIAMMEGNNEFIDYYLGTANCLVNDVRDIVTEEDMSRIIDIKNNLLTYHDNYDNNPGAGLTVLRQQHDKLTKILTLYGFNPLVPETINI